LGGLWLRINRPIEVPKGAIIWRCTVYHNNVTLGDEARRGPPPTPPQRVVPEAAAVCLRLWVGVGGCFGRLFSPSFFVFFFFFYPPFFRLGG